MAAFPETIVPAEPYTWRPVFSTIIGGPYGNGSDVRSVGWQYPLHECSFRLPARTPLEDMIDYYNFFVARKGKFEPFTFFDWLGWDSNPIGVQWTGLYVGLAPYGTTAVDLPGKSISSYDLYQSGTRKDGLVIQETGTDGKDIFVPTTNWTPNALLTVDFVGRRSYKASFAEDGMDFQYFACAVASTGIGLRERR